MHKSGGILPITVALSAMAAFAALSLTGLSGCGGFYRDKKRGEPFSVKDSQLSFSEVRTRVFETRCNTCHRSGGSAGHAPFQEYAQVRSHLAEIQARALDDGHDMPPAGNPQLSASEAGLLSRWIALGAPEFAQQAVSGTGTTTLTATLTATQTSTGSGTGTGTGAGVDPSGPWNFGRLSSEVLGPRCFDCHHPDRPAYSGIPLHTYADTVTDGGYVVPGQPDKSDLYLSVTRAADRMPKGRPALPAAEVEAIRSWIQSGAPER